MLFDMKLICLGIYLGLSHYYREYKKLGRVSHICFSFMTGRVIRRRKENANHQSSRCVMSPHTTLTGDTLSILKYFTTVKSQTFIILLSHKQKHCGNWLSQHEAYTTLFCPLVVFWGRTPMEDGTTVPCCSVFFSSDVMYSFYNPLVFITI